jgi:hypothetical protein
MVTSDADGRVVLPWLRPGKYYILGRSKPDREDYLYLKISSSGRKWDDLDLNLNPVRGSAEWVLDSLKTISQATQVPTFRGAVEYLLGKQPAPDADIDVFTRELGIDQQPIHLWSDSMGEFSANLPDGHYAVHIRKDASECLFLVDISQRATSARLQVRLIPEITE